MGDITELVTSWLEHSRTPISPARGEYLPLVAISHELRMKSSDTLNRQDHNFFSTKCQKKFFAGFFPGAAGLAEMFGYFQSAHVPGFRFRATKLALANKSQAGADKVPGVGSSEFPCRKERPLGSTVIENEQKVDFKPCRQT